MKKLVLTRQQARHLLISLENSGKSMSEMELRRFDKKIAWPIHQLFEAYDSRIQDIARKYSTINDVATRDELIEKLNDTHGKNIVFHEFEDADFEWLLGMWGSLKFSSERFARGMVLDIGDALLQADHACVATSGSNHTHEGPCEAEVAMPKEGD